MTSSVRVVIGFTEYFEVGGRYKYMTKNRMPGSRGMHGHPHRGALPPGAAERRPQVAAFPHFATQPVKLEQPLLRSELGDVLRSLRSHQGRTLREVSSDAQVSLGYLSEVERGQKEASSELLEAICGALGVPLWLVLREVSDRLMIESSTVPDTIPDDLLPESLTAS